MAAVRGNEGYADGAVGNHGGRGTTGRGVRGGVRGEVRVIKGRRAGRSDDQDVAVLSYVVTARRSDWRTSCSTRPSRNVRLRS